MDLIYLANPAFPDPCTVCVRLSLLLADEHSLPRSCKSTKTHARPHTQAKAEFFVFVFNTARCMFLECTCWERPSHNNTRNDHNSSHNQERPRTATATMRSIYMYTYHTKAFFLFPEKTTLYDVLKVKNYESPAMQVRNLTLWLI